MSFFSPSLLSSRLSLELQLFVLLRSSPLMEAHSASSQLAGALLGGQGLGSPRKVTQALVANFHKLNDESGS